MPRVDLPEPLPVELALKGLAAELTWPEVARDLVEVACAVLLADRLTPRPRGTLGPREIALRVGVRRPGVWARASAQLREILSILGDDAFSFDFFRKPDGNLPFPEPPSTPGRRYRRVALFSGGLDSAAAAATFAKDGTQTAYVTHYAKGIRHIAALLGDIHRVYGGQAEPGHAQFYIRPVGAIVQHLRENSRRSRSFLFVSLALATAVCLEAPEVCVCENGALALNLPLSPAMVPTRHAHSEFLRAMEELSKLLFGTPIRVTNPFELATKGEMCRVFVPHPGLALDTVSCWNQQWSGRGRKYSQGHCGLCLPCLVRLASLEAAKIAVPKGHFDCDVRRLAAQRRPKREVLRRLGMYRALVGFATRVRSCGTWRRFLKSFPEVIGTQPTSGRMSQDQWFKRLFGMTKRFAEEVTRSFGQG